MSKFRLNAIKKKKNEAWRLWEKERRKESIFAREINRAEMSTRWLPGTKGRRANVFLPFDVSADVWFTLHARVNAADRRSLPFGVHVNNAVVSATCDAARRAFIASSAVFCAEVWRRVALNQERLVQRLLLLPHQLPAVDLQPVQSQLQWLQSVCIKEIQRIRINWLVNNSRLSALKP